MLGRGGGVCVCAAKDNWGFGLLWGVIAHSLIWGKHFSDRNTGLIAVEINQVKKWPSLKGSKGSGFL